MPNQDDFLPALATPVVGLGHPLGFDGAGCGAVAGHVGGADGRGAPVGYVGGYHHSDDNISIINNHFTKSEILEIMNYIRNAKIDLGIHRWRDDGRWCGITCRRSSGPDSSISPSSESWISITIIGISSRFIWSSGVVLRFGTGAA